MTIHTLTTSHGKTSTKENSNEKITRAMVRLQDDRLGNLEHGTATSVHHQVATTG